MTPIRVMVVDDSPFMRKAIERMLDAPDIRVVGTARDGQDALDKLAEVQPDIVTLDVEMPRMDGLTCLKRIMAAHPMPVLMVSSLTQEGAQATLEALAAGAVDFIPKESSLASSSVLQMQQELQEKIRKLARSPKFKQDKAPSASPTSLVSPTSRVSHAVGGSIPGQPRAELMLIGCSTGGPKALQDLLPALPANFPVPILVVQHMPATFTKPFAERLDSLCQVQVKEAVDGEAPRAGTVYVAPGGLHLFYRTRGNSAFLELNPEPADTLHRPSVDTMFLSVAEHCARQVFAAILTGMGSDGARGMTALKAKGAHTLAEAEETCVVYGMPKAAVERRCVDAIAPLTDIARILRAHFQV